MCNQGGGDLHLLNETCFNGNYLKFARFQEIHFSKMSQKRYKIDLNLKTSGWYKKSVVC